jgi:hypothetical protein
MVINVGSNMFIINIGRMEVIASDEVTVLQALCEGNFFGDTTFFKQGRRKVYVKTNSLCNISILYKKDFDDAVARFPGLYDTIKERAEASEKREVRLTTNFNSNLQQKAKLKYMINASEGEC